MVGGNGRVGGQEPNQGRCKVKCGWAVVKESFQEHVGFKHWNCDSLPSVPEHAGHGNVHGKDVVHGQHTDGGLLHVHYLHIRMS